MKDKFLLGILSLLSFSLACFGLAACGGESQESHSHTYSKDYTYDEDFHWRQAICGDTDDTIEYACHSFMEVSRISPTHMTDGKLVSRCEECGYEKTEIMPAYSDVHTYSSSWSQNTYAHWHIATCGHSELTSDYANHDYDGGFINIAATHTTDGQITYTCSTCGYKKVETIEAYTSAHTYSDEWSYGTDSHWYASTCEHSGLKKDYADHTFDDGVVTKQPTHTENGLEVFTCTVCGYIKSHILAADVDAHTYSDEWSTNESQHWHDSTCEHILTKGMAIHSFEVEETIPATHTTNGLTIYTCTVCGYSKRQTIAADSNAHTYSDEWTSDEYEHWKVATCEHTDEIGYEGQHTYDDGVETIPATHTTEGLMTYTCAVCGYTKTQTIAADSNAHTYSDEWSTDENEHWKVATCEHTDLIACRGDHSFDDGVITVVASLSTNGKKVYTCKICGYERVEILPMQASTEKSTINIEYALSADKNYYSVKSIGYATDTDIVLPSTVNGKPLKKISEGAFSGNSQIESIFIPSSVEIIGRYAFNSCNNLTSVIADEGLKQICEYAFYNCSSLSTVVINEGLTQIDTCAFYGCFSLDNITLPNTIESIAEKAFEQTAYYNNEANWTGKTTLYIGKYLIKTRYTVLETSNILNGTLLIADKAYSDSVNLLAVTFPKTLKYIGNYAFYNCKQLSQLALPYSLIAIGENAFKDCTDLQEVTLRDNLQKVSAGAFYNCTSLRAITLPDSVTTMGNSVFYNCTSLKQATISQNVTALPASTFYNCTSLNGVTLSCELTAIGSYAFYSCKALNELNMPQTLLSIGDFAFNSCTSLKTIDIPDSVTSIGLNGVFYYCTSLENVKIGNGVATLPQYMFEGCTAITSITLPFIGGERDATYGSATTLFGYIFNAEEHDGTYSTKIYSGNNSDYTTLISYIPSSLTNVVITGGSIFTGAFNDCGSLKTIILPDDITSIADLAFNDCSSLESIIIPSSVTSIGTEVFTGCSSLQSMVLPFVGDQIKSSTDTDQYPFGYLFGTSSYTGGEQVKQTYYGSILTSTTYNTYYIPSTLKNVVITGGNILYGAFCNCKNLESIVLPEGLTAISNYAFSGCASLINITIPDSVTSIGNSAFQNCTSLKHIVIPDSVTELISCAFQNCTGLESIVLPDGLETIGNSAFANCSSLTEVYYMGTEEQWAHIDINQNGNSYFINACVYYYMEVEPDVVGNYWCYDEDKNIKIW